MKQLTIFVNSDLESKVVSVLDHAGVDGFLHVGDATGNRFLPEGEIPRSVTWEAVMFVVPVTEERQAERIAKELAAVASDCGTEPCLRVVATPADLLV